MYVGCSALSNILIMKHMINCVIIPVRKFIHYFVLIETWCKSLSWMTTEVTRVNAYATLRYICWKKMFMCAAHLHKETSLYRTFTWLLQKTLSYKVHTQSREDYCTPMRWPNCGQTDPTQQPHNYRCLYS